MHRLDRGGQRSAFFLQGRRVRGGLRDELSSRGWREKCFETRMHGLERFFTVIVRILYGVASVGLTVISLAMIGAAVMGIWDALGLGQPIKQALLNGIGLVVVAIAVFDVAKYLIEEEVLRDRELRSAREARETTTKFVVIIVIAVSLEALVFILGAASQDLSLLVYPAALLAVSALLIMSLAVYLRLSSTAEQKLGECAEGEEGE